MAVLLEVEDGEKRQKRAVATDTSYRDHLTFLISNLCLQQLNFACLVIDYIPGMVVNSIDKLDTSHKESMPFLTRLLQTMTAAKYPCSFRLFEIASLVIPLAFLQVVFNTATRGCYALHFHISR